MPFPVLLSAIYAWMVRDASAEGIKDFDRQLFAAPPGLKAEVMRSQPEWQNAGADFVAQLATRGPSGRTTG